MSNLNLPKMTYTTLSGLIHLRAAQHRYGPVKLAYETTAERVSDGSVLVRHHGNPIAQIGPDWFTLSGAGWNSSTTATRLAQILRDNQTTLPPADSGFDDRLHYSVSSRDNRRERGLYLVAWNHTTKLTLVRDIQFGSAHFSRVDAQRHYVLHGE